MDFDTYTQVLEVLRAFDGHNLYDIGHHVKLKYIPITFTCKYFTCEFEVPLDLLEECLSDRGKMDWEPQFHTPNGTLVSVERFGLTLTGPSPMDKFKPKIAISKRVMSCYMKVLEENGEFHLGCEAFSNFNFLEPKAKLIEFTYTDQDDDASFEGPGKGKISMSNYTRDGLSYEGPCDRKEAEEIVEKDSTIYNIFRTLAKYMV